MELQVTLAGLDDFAALFWKNVPDAKVCAVHGAMGAGKTTTIAALCRAKSIQQSPSSPTFSIINEYSYAEHGVLKKLYHIDLYRLQNEEEIAQAGVEDCVYSGAICFVEWPERAPHLFDDTTLHLIIEPVNESERLVRLLTASAFRNRQEGEPR